MPNEGWTQQVSGVGSTTGAALVEVYDLTPPAPTTTLYLAQLRPDAAVAASIGSGYATILVSEDGKSGTVNVSFSNLSSAQTAGYLRIDGDPVMSFGPGQVSGRGWTFQATSAHSTEAIINALQIGRLTVRIDSARFGEGELRGNFVRAQGSQTFSAPAAPPALAAGALTTPSRDDAVRFLTQATFGPTFGDIDSLVTKGLPRWLDEQMALPPTSLKQMTRADAADFPNPPQPPTQRYFKVSTRNMRSAWAKVAITAPDQLRQRVAFALSQIFVVSTQAANIGVHPEALAKYCDILGGHAFGNFRQLLEEVTLNPMMGEYLSHLQNQKANPARGTSPDENYAREVQQLITIGLFQLQPDGTLLLERTAASRTCSRHRRPTTSRPPSAASARTRSSTARRSPRRCAAPRPCKRRFRIQPPRHGWPWWRVWPLFRGPHARCSASSVVKRFRSRNAAGELRSSSALAHAYGKANHGRESRRHFDCVHRGAGSRRVFAK